MFRKRVEGETERIAFRGRLPKLEREERTEEAVPTDPPKPLLTPSQVGERLSISASAVRNLCRSGKLAHFRIGAGKKRQLFRISEEQLAEYLSQASQKTSPQRRRRKKQADGEDYPLLRARGMN